MQAMNTEQTYYPTSPGTQQAGAEYLITNGIHPPYPMRNPNTYSQTPRMSQPFYAAPMTNNYGQQAVYLSPYLPNAPFVHTTGPRGMNPSYTHIIRPPNETPNGSQTFIPQTQYTHPYQPTPTMYNPTQYTVYPSAPNYPQASTNYSQASTNYSQGLTNYSQPSTQVSNQPQSQSQYSVTNSQQPMPSPQTSQPSSHDQQLGQSSQPLHPTDKRQKKPLLIVDPVSHKPLELETSAQATNLSSTTTTEDSVTDSPISNPQSTDEVAKSQIRKEFQQQVAQRLLDNSNPQTDKDTNQSVTEETLTKENQPEEEAILAPTTSSASSSRSGSISNQSSEQPQPDAPDIRTSSITEDKSITQTNEDDIEHEQSNSQIETASITSQSTSNDTTNEVENQLSPTESLENVTATQANDTESEPINTEKTPSVSKRHGYTIEELRSKRFVVVSQERPQQLKDVPGVTTPKQPPKPKFDGNLQYEREVRSILNKVTPQMYDKLLQQLEKLELNNAERLEGMISVIFTKAVEAAIFCSLYADICKHFKKTQVTVPDTNGQPVTYYFRQILLQRCQKEFESDYRQEIGYEKRQAEVDAITDDKTRKEAEEQLQEDLLKAKRKKLGNIIFIGELFKLEMLTDTIMYACIEYLLRDKTDEESLECLYRLLRTIGKELDAKAGEKTANRKNLEKHYAELNSIIKQRQTSSRIRFLMEDLMEMRRANWVARRADAKPTTIDDIHEKERLRLEKQERDRPPRRDQMHGGGGGGGSQQYTGSRGSRGSGMKQQTNRMDDDRIDNRVIVNSLREFHSNDKRNQGAMSLSLAPQRPWAKGSGVEKKAEDDRSNTGRTGKPPAGLNPQFRPKMGTPPGTPGYPVQRQPSRELARENSPRDRENAMEALRKSTNPNEKTSPNNTSITNSREGSRTTSPESSVPEQTLPTNITTTTIATTNVSTSFDEEKTQTRVHALIEEYTENYSDSNDRSVNEAIEDLTSFCTENLAQQAVVVRELFTNVLEAKPRARKAVGHLLDVALHKNVISTEGFLSGLKIFIEVVPDYAVDIPFIWQYIGEIIGAFIGAPSSNMILLKPILQSIPETTSKQLFQDIIRYAVEFSSKTCIQKYWQSAGFSLNDLIQSDSAFLNEYNWLTESIESETPTTATAIIKETPSPQPDPQLVTLFKSINDQSTIVTDDQILSYIHQNMNSNDKFYIRNIVSSYLEACLINREPQKKIQEDIAKRRMTVLNAIIEHKPEGEIQAVYAIQNFVHKLEHPQKMAQLLFDIFYDEDCVTEQTFFEWKKHPDQSETEGHAVVELSTKDFFEWLEQDNEGEGEEEEE